MCCQLTYTTVFKNRIVYYDYPLGNFFIYLQWQILVIVTIIIIILIYCSQCDTRVLTKKN